MQFKEFLRFEKKKLVFPLLLVFLSIYVLYPHYRIASIWDEFGCDMISAITDQKDDFQKNSSDLPDMAIIDNFFVEFENYNDYVEDGSFHSYVSDVIYGLDPFLPYPCIVASIDHNCEYYVSRETYDCFNRLNHRQSDEDKSGLYSDIAHIDEPPYKPLSLITVFTNILILFTEGYLISSIILCIYRKISEQPPSVNY